MHAGELGPDVILALTMIIIVFGGLAWLFKQLAGIFDTNSQSADFWDNTANDLQGFLDKDAKIKEEKKQGKCPHKYIH